MDEMATELDGRFSDPEAEPTSWDATRRALEDANLSWISTVRADGRPHVTPLVTVWRDGALHFCSGPDEQKSRNLRANPDVVVTTGRNEWRDGIDVMVEGRAKRVTDRETLTSLAEAWKAKWDGDWVFDVGDEGFLNDVGGPADVWAVEPAKVLVFAKGTFSQTRHLPLTTI